MLKKNSNNQIKKGAVMSYFSIFLNIAAGLIYTPWMISQIGQSNYGLYTLASSVIAFFSMDFGLGSAVSKFLSQYKARGDEEWAKKFLGITYKLFIVISAIIFIVLVIIYLLIENIYIELTPIEIEKLKVIFLVSGAFTVLTFSFKPLDGILIANERFTFLKISDLIHRLLIVSLMVMALLLGYGLYTLVVVNAFAGLLKVVIKYVYINRNTTTEVDFKHSNSSLLKEIAGFSAWTTIVAVAQRFILNITPTILGAFAGSIQISLFAVGMTIEGYTWTISSALGGLFLPKVTRMAVNNQGRKEIENLLIRVGRIQLLIVGIIIVGFASLGQEFMRLWMGAGFEKAYYVALLLILPGLITLTQQIASTALIALNEIKYQAIGSCVAACISIMLSLALSRDYGAIGAAVSIFIGNTIGLVVFMNIIYHKILKINVLRFFKECHLEMMLPLIMTFFIGVIIQNYFFTKSLALFMLKSAILGAIYGTLMWKISLNKYEKCLFFDIFKNIFRINNKSRRINFE